MSRLLLAKEVLKKKMFCEEKLCDEKSCRMCLVKFSEKNLYEDHCKCLKHKVRLRYLNEPETFENSGYLKFKLLGENDSNKTKHSSQIELKFERNVAKSTTIQVINTSESSIEIMEVIQINGYQKGVEIEAQFKNAMPLENGETFNIVIKACFKNSTSFTFPVVVVCKVCKTREIKYFLKNIDVHVSSEFSFLVPVSSYTKPKKIAHTLLHETIIPGERPELYKSYYKEVYPLRSYHIPEQLQNKLNELIAMCPNFIERHTFSKANIFFYENFASDLRLNPSLQQRNYCSLLDTLISIEENQIKVDMRHFDSLSKLTLVNGNIYDLKVPGLAESRPSLIIHDAVYVKERSTDNYKFQGVVCQVFENSVRLSFNQRFSQIYHKKKQFHIEFSYNRRPLKVQKQALLLAREHNIVAYFYPKESQFELKDQQNINELTYFNPKLNDEQKRAVVNILVERNAPYLIFGPPGTGKTVTVVESILQICETKPEARILVCAPSNSATNEIAIRLAQKLPSTKLFRLIGNMYGQDKRLTEIKDIININNAGSFFMPSMEDILKYRVLLTTLVTAARLVNGGIQDGHYTHVFIDESGYATESESLIPIAGILSNSTNSGKVTGQIVLAGDPRQLGPVVHSNFVKYCGYGRSMLERLLDTCEIYARDESRPIPYNERFVTKLVKNYRSHEAILRIPNKLFYHNELVSAGNEDCNMFTDWEHLTTPRFPVIFHHIVGEDGRENNSPSFFNIQEIEEVVEYLKKLVRSTVKTKEITEEDIGIITPYRKQAQILRKACEKQGWKNLLVGSVEQFQGKEKPVIIISTVRSKNINEFQEIDIKCQLGFVRNPKRFNVAITRAKALLIVIGNGDVLKTDKNWFHFIEFCVNNKSVKGKSFHLSDDEYLEEEISSPNLNDIV